MVKTFLYSLESCTDVSDSIAIDLEQHFLDYGKVAKGRSPLKGISDCKSFAGVGRECKRAVGIRFSQCKSKGVSATITYV